MGTIEGNALTGFQMAAERGPLCDEPLFGVNVRLEVFPKSGDEEGTADAGAGEEQYGPFSGQVTSAAREAIRRAVLKAGPRLVEAMYLSVITTTSEALGGTYSVLGRRARRSSPKQFERVPPSLLSTRTFRSRSLLVSLMSCGTAARAHPTPS